MSNSIEFEMGEYGLRAVLKSRWDNSYFGLLESRGVTELELNMAKGWRGATIAFVSQMPRLRSLIIHDFAIDNVESIHSLTELRQLEIHTYCGTPIRFECFPYLRVCGLEWRKGAESVFDCSQLESLFLNRLTHSSSRSFVRLINLQRLTLLNAPIEEVEGFSPLSHLTFLRMANLRKLMSLDGISNLIGLEILEIQKCPRIHSLEPMAGLTNLTKLVLTDLGSIENIAVVRGMHNLEILVFPGTTNVLDGDLSPLENLKYLKRVSFQNRRHYSHRREDFGTAYFGNPHSC